MEEETHVAAGENSDDAMADDDHELNQLHDCYHWFDEREGDLELFVPEGAQVVVRIHDDVNARVDHRDVNRCKLCNSRNV